MTPASDGEGMPRDDKSNPNADKRASAGTGGAIKPNIPEDKLSWSEQCALTMGKDNLSGSRFRNVE